MLKSKEYYQDLLDKVEPMLDMHIENMVADSGHKNPKTEEYIIALCNAKDYLMAKIAKITLNEFTAQREAQILNGLDVIDTCVEHERENMTK